MSPEEQATALRHLLGRIEEVKQVSGKGEVSFRDGMVSEYLAILHGLDLCSSQLPQIEQRGLLTRAVFNAAKSGKLTDSALRQELGRLEAEFFRKQPRKYHLVTSMSVARGSFSRRVRAGGLDVRIGTRIPRRFLEGYAQVTQTARFHVKGDVPWNYSHVRAQVEARSEAEAVDACIDALNLFRAMWNLFFNRRIGFRWSTGRSRPLNPVVLGPLHSLHLPDGTPVTDKWWFESGFREPLDAKDLAGDARKLLKFENSVRGYLRASKYRRDIESALRRYCQAFDEYDWHRAFLLLWGVLEFLTASTDKDPRATIRRAAFLFVERDYAEIRLKTLRDFRNRNVHAARESEEIEAYVFVLKRHVERLIEFHLASEMRFGSIAEAAEFLDLPRDRRMLERRLSLLVHRKHILTRYGQ